MQLLAAGAAALVTVCLMLGIDELAAQRQAAQPEIATSSATIAA